MKALLLAAAALVYAPLAAAEETYDLSEREPVVGQKTESLRVFDGTNGKMTLFVNGKPAATGTTTFRSEVKSVTTIHEVEDGHPSAYTEVITASAIRSTRDFMGQKADETSASPLLNAEVRYTLVDGEYVPELANATDEQREELEPEFFTTVSAYPDRPMKIGDIFELTPEMVAAMTDQEFDPEQEAVGSGRLKLNAVEVVGGERCGVLGGELKIKAPMNERDVPEGMDSGEIELEVTGKIVRSLETLIDVKVDLKGKTRFKYRWTEDGQPLELVVEMDVELTGYEKLLAE
ncbi:MAG: hypothetical protein ACPGYV_05670 [Phycisphaeraceae bacterium]